MSTPTLSSLIESLQKSWSQETFEGLLLRLYQTRVGVLAGKNKPDEPIQAYLAEGEQVAFSSTTQGDGKRRIVAFADPRAFFDKFGPKFNGEVSGAQLMHTVLDNAACEGVILNSAESTTSVSLGRADIERFVQAIEKSKVN